VVGLAFLTETGGPEKEKAFGLSEGAGGAVKLMLEMDVFTSSHLSTAVGDNGCSDDGHGQPSLDLNATRRIGSKMGAITHLATKLSRLTHGLALVPSPPLPCLDAGAELGV
jgi:hypothetical protein